MQISLLYNALKFFMSRLIPALALTFIVMLYSRELSKEDYGVYQTVWTYLSVCIIFSSFGLPKLILSHINQASLSMLIKVLLYGLLIVLTLVAVFLFFGQNIIDNLSSFWFLILLASQTVYFFQEALILSDKSEQKIIGPNIVYALLIVITHLIVLYLFPYSLSRCIMGISFVSILRNIQVWKFYSSKLHFEISESKKNIWIQLFWTGLNDFLSVITKWIDKVFLIFILTPGEFGIYFNGTYELPLIGMILMAFQMILTVQGAKEMSENKLIATFNESTLALSSVLFPLCAFLILNSKETVVLLFGDKFISSSEFFALSALILPVRICNYTVLLQLKNKGRKIVVGSILDFIVCIILMGSLYNIIGIYGILLGTILATYVQAGFYLFVIIKEYNTSLVQLLSISKLIVRMGTCIIVLGGLKYLLTILDYNKVTFIVELIISVGLGLYFLNQSVNFKTILPFVINKGKTLS